MALQGEHTIAAPRQRVWDALHDPAVLQACIPGCEELTRRSDTEFDAKITAQLGPIRSTFTTLLLLSNSNPPQSFTLSGEGKGVAGFGRGAANVELAECESGTILRYEGQLGTGGKLAQIGSRLVEAATRSYAERFFAAFAELLNAEPAQAPGTAQACFATPERDS